MKRNGSFGQHCDSVLHFCAAMIAVAFAAATARSRSVSAFITTTTTSTAARFTSSRIIRRQVVNSVSFVGKTHCTSSAQKWSRRSSWGKNNHHGCLLASSSSTFSSSSSRASPASSTKQQKNKKQIEETTVEISPANHNITRLQEFSSKELGNKQLVQALQKQGITKPTPIQAYGIPLLRQGHDLMASAQTGVGKTLMFSIPILEDLLQQPSNANKYSSTTPEPVALILNPTRELAIQTANTIQDLLKHSNNNNNVQVRLATGGESVSLQRKQLRTISNNNAGPMILVATPGRLLQFVDERFLSLRKVQHVVCDESDRMVDLGFEPQLRRIVRALPKATKTNNNNNQTHTSIRTTMCSATFPPDVQRIAADFLKPDYYFVAVGRVGATHANIQQKLVWADSGTRNNHHHDGRKVDLVVDEIRRFFKQQSPDKSSYLPDNKSKQSQVIVFCNTKDEVERIGSVLSKNFSQQKVRVVTGDKTQQERNQALEAFRKQKVQILVATDVAARGLDVPTVGLVVQADVPRDVDTYVHRIGRTGRAGASGLAVAFIDGRSIGMAPAFVQLLREAQQSVPTWLLGMSHITRARNLEEEGAIAAGGGSLGGTLGKLQSQESVDGGDGDFSVQDFRNNADAGSWGSERSTAYHAFDEDAYGEFDVESISMDSVDDEETMDGEDVSNDESLVVESDENVAERSLDGSSGGTNGSLSENFERQRPSKDLIGALRHISGVGTVVDAPDQEIYRKLSQRSQLLRFEYLGLFAFDSVSDILMRKGNGQNGDSSDGNDMPKVLMVAEKPSIAKAIADALSGKNGPRQKRGISRALPVYEFTTTGFAPAQTDDRADSNPKRCRVIVTSVVGHVFSLGFDRQQNQGTQDPSEYFNMPVVKQEEGSTSKLRVADHLRALASDSDHLVLWLDCDAEGENIAHEVIGITRRAIEQKVSQEVQANPDAAPRQRVHRARFSAISAGALRDAFSNLVQPDPLLSLSVDARQELDLRVGVAITRLLTWKCVGLARKNFSAATKFISYGPCQTPALSFCADRAHDIETFNPQTFWRVEVAAAPPGKRQEPLLLRWNPPRASVVTSNRRRIGRSGNNDGLEESASFDKKAASNVAGIASQPGSYATVVEVQQFSEKMQPPLALNTVALLAAGSKAMGMSPKKVMQTAEKLYSAGFLSYPRTETTRYDPSFDASALLREHVSHPEWGKTASYLLRSKYQKTRRAPSRGKDAGDHPPITCLKSATRNDVGGGAEWRVYEFVARNLLGSLSDELVFTRQSAKLQLAHGESDTATETCFELENVKVDSLGFAGACPWVLRDIGAGPTKEEPLQFQKGQKLHIVKAQTEVSQTRPPAFLQEHELIGLMDENGIGTDASMATHINNIVERGYVVLCDETGELLRPPRPPRPGQKPLPRQIGRYLVPTSLGRSVMDLFREKNCSEATGVDSDALSPALLARPAIRAQMEKEVGQIAKGKLDKAECLSKNLAWFESRYVELEQSLSRNRVNDFARSLVPTRESLRYWNKLGAFEKADGNASTSAPRKNTGKRGSHQSRGPTSGTKRKPGQKANNLTGSKRQKGATNRGKQTNAVR